MDLFAQVKNFTKNFLVLSLVGGILMPAQAKIEGEEKFRLSEAKSLAKNAKVIPIEGTHSFEAYYEDYMIVFDLIPGDATTLGFAGGIFSFDPLASDDENLLNFSRFLEKQFKKELGRKGEKSVAKRYFDQFLESLFPKAHANGLLIAAVVAVIAIAIFAFVKKDKKTKEQAKKDKKSKKEKNYEVLISEQFVKGDKYRAQNAALLADNTKQFQGRPNPDAHDCYIMSRAWHDHMKYPEKNYAPNRSNYQCI